MLQIYDALFAITGSPVVAINRALAMAELHGARAGLDAMPDHDRDRRLAEYQPYWAARAELLAKTGARARLSTHMRLPSVSNAIPRSAVFSSGAAREWFQSRARYARIGRRIKSMVTIRQRLICPDKVAASPLRWILPAQAAPLSCAATASWSRV